MDSNNIYIPKNSKRSIFDLSCRTGRASSKMPNISASPKSEPAIYPNKFKIINHPDEATSVGLYYINTRLPEHKFEYLEGWIAKTLREQFNPAGFKNAAIDSQRLNLPLAEQRYEMSTAEIDNYYKQGLNPIRFMHGCAILWGQKIRGTEEYVYSAMTKIKLLISCLELVTNLDLASPDSETRYYAREWIYYLPDRISEIRNAVLDFETAKLRWQLQRSTEICTIDLSDEKMLSRDLKIYKDLIIK